MGLNPRRGNGSFGQQLSAPARQRITEAHYYLVAATELPKNGRTGVIRLAHTSLAVALVAMPGPTRELDSLGRPSVSHVQIRQQLIFSLAVTASGAYLVG